MANSADIFLQRDTVKLVGSGKSPVVDVEGGNNWNLDSGDGDVRIGDDSNNLRMGVALGGAGAGNAELRASSKLHLGGDGSSVVSVGSDGLQPGSSGYSLGSHQNRWDSAWFDGDIVSRGGIDVDDTIETDGDIFCLGGWGVISHLMVEDVAFGLSPHTGGSEDLGSSRKRWDTLYVKSVNKGSDARLKTDVADYDGGLDAMLDLRPITYRWRDDDDETHLGLLAQEVAEVLPDVVEMPDDEDGHLGIDYTELVAVLVDAVQEQHAETTELAETVDRQRERIDDLEDRTAALEARLAALEAE